MQIAKILLFFFLAVLVLFVPATSDRVNSVCFGEACFAVELADSSNEREKGLMFRQTLDENRGMLFIFNKAGVYPFWMKNTFIPLDIIWLDGAKKVVFIARNAQPCQKKEICQTINPEVPAKYVLEINSGLAQKFGIEIGDEMKF